MENPPAQKRLTLIFFCRSPCELRVLRDSVLIALEELAQQMIKIQKYYKTEHHHSDTRD